MPPHCPCLAVIVGDVVCGGCEDGTIGHNMLEIEAEFGRRERVGSQPKSPDEPGGAGELGAPGEVRRSGVKGVDVLERARPSVMARCSYMN